MSCNGPTSPQRPPLHNGSFLLSPKRPLWRGSTVVTTNWYTNSITQALFYYSTMYNWYYYSFKIFPQIWLAKSTRIIHHNQLLMTKFGRILCLTRKWRQKCSLRQVNAPLTAKTWGRDWLVFVVKTKMADTSLISRARTTAGTRRNSG